MTTSNVFKIVAALLVVVAIVAVVVVSMTGEEAATPSATTADQSQTKQTEQAKGETDENVVYVTIDEYKYSPTNLVIKAGTTVEWTNNDAAGHSVTGDDIEKSGLDSNVFGKGETFRYTFDTPGEFSYFCKPHPYMKAAVTVTE